MSVKLCHYLKPDGITCHSPALRGRQYCYFHLRDLQRLLRRLRNQRRANP